MSNTKKMYPKDFTFFRKMINASGNEELLNGVIRAEVERRFKRELKIADNRWKRAEEKLRTYETD